MLLKPKFKAGSEKPHSWGDRLPSKFARVRSESFVFHDDDLSGTCGRPFKQACMVGFVSGKIVAQCRTSMGGKEGKSCEAEGRGGGQTSGAGEGQ